MDLNFKEPITTFAYNMISLHHDIMWYIVIILTLVYWVLYKVLKKYSWNTFNKQDRFLLYFLNKTLIINIQKIIFYFWILFFINSPFYYFSSLTKILINKLDKTIIIRILNF